MNIVHYKLRNRLHVSSVEAILKIRYGLKFSGVTCVGFIPTKNMVRNFYAKGFGESGEEEDAPVDIELID